MFKTMYLITFLSVLLLNSETSFSQSLKKELGICGKSFNAILKIEKEKAPILSTTVMGQTEFCDNGRYEENANFVISLYNAKDQLIYDKYIFLNPLTYSEKTNKKGEFINTKISDAGNSRIVKFPISTEMGEVTSYRIKSLTDNKTYDLQKIKW